LVADRLKESPRFLGGLKSELIIIEDEIACEEAMKASAA
jgi:hypothetical protein